MSTTLSFYLAIVGPSIEYTVASIAIVKAIAPCVAGVAQSRVSRNRESEGGIAPQPQPITTQPGGADCVLGFSLWLRRPLCNVDSPGVGSHIGASPGIATGNAYCAVATISTIAVASVTPVSKAVPTVACIPKTTVASITSIANGSVAS